MSFVILKELERVFVKNSNFVTRVNLLKKIKVETQSNSFNITKLNFFTNDISVTFWIKQRLTIYPKSMRRPKIETCIQT